MENELMPFDYGSVDSATADKLKKHENAIKAIQSKAVYDIGEELHEAREEMAHDRTGNGFLKWCNDRLGLKRTTVENILNYCKCLIT